MFNAAVKTSERLNYHYSTFDVNWLYARLYVISSFGLFIDDLIVAITELAEGIVIDHSTDGVLTYALLECDLNIMLDCLSSECRTNTMTISCIHEE